MSARQQPAGPPGRGPPVATVVQPPSAPVQAYTVERDMAGLNLGVVYPGTARHRRDTPPGAAPVNNGGGFRGPSRNSAFSRPRNTLAAQSNRAAAVNAVPRAPRRRTPEQLAAHNARRRAATAARRAAAEASAARGEIEAQQHRRVAAAARQQRVDAELARISNEVNGYASANTWNGAASSSSSSSVSAPAPPATSFGFLTGGAPARDESALVRSVRGPLDDHTPGAWDNRSDVEFWNAVNQLPANHSSAIDKSRVFADTGSDSIVQVCLRNAPSMRVFVIYPTRQVVEWDESSGCYVLPPLPMRLTPPRASDGTQFLYPDTRNLGGLPSQTHGREYGLHMTDFTDAYTPSPPVPSSAMSSVVIPSGGTAWGGPSDGGDDDEEVSDIDCVSEGCDGDGDDNFAVAPLAADDLSDDEAKYFYGDESDGSEEWSEQPPSGNDEPGADVNGGGRGVSERERAIRREFNAFGNQALRDWVMSLDEDDDRVVYIQESEAQNIASVKFIASGDYISVVYPTRQVVSYDDEQKTCRAVNPPMRITPPRPGDHVQFYIQDTRTNVRVPRVIPHTGAEDEYVIFDMVRGDESDDDDE